MISTDEEAMDKHTGQYDLLISTVPQPYAMQPFVNLLRLDGTLVSVAIQQTFEDVRGSGLWRRRRSIAGSVIGGIAETQEVIDYCTARQIKAEIQIVRPDQINECMDRVNNKQALYRFVIDMSSGRKA